MSFFRKFYTDAVPRTDIIERLDQENYKDPMNTNDSITYSTLEDFIYIHEKEMEVEKKLIEALKKLPPDMLLFPISAFDSYVTGSRRHASDTLRLIFDHIVNSMDAIVDCKEMEKDLVPISICRLNRKTWTPKRIPNSKDETYIKEAIHKMNLLYDEWLKYVEIKGPEK